MIEEGFGDDNSFVMNPDDFPSLSQKPKPFFITSDDPCILEKGKRTIVHLENKSRIKVSRTQVYTGESRKDGLSILLSMKMVYKLLINSIITKRQAIDYAKMLSPNSMPAKSTENDITSTLKLWADCATKSGIP